MYYLYIDIYFMFKMFPSNVYDDQNKNLQIK